MAVPFIDLKRFEDGFHDAWVKKVGELSAECKFMGGDEIALVEQHLREDNAVGHAVSCANGTDALQLALRAAGVGPGDVVLLPDSTFWATFEAVVNVGASPVTVDINLNDLQMDFDLYQQAVGKFKPKAALLVHLYGWGSARLADFREFSKKNNVLLIEDGAQCYGVEYKGQSIYAGAYASTISFYPAKVYGAAGDAGALLSSDDAFADRARSLANHGRELHYAHGLCGWNSRMDSLQAAYLNLVYPHLKARLASRRTAAARYRKELGAAGITCVSAPADYLENAYLNATLHEPDMRAKLQEALKAKGIGFGVVYPGAVSEQKGAQGLLKDSVGGENARRLSATVLNLPLFPYMRDEEIDEVISVVKSVYGK